MLPRTYRLLFIVNFMFFYGSCTASIDANCVELISKRELKYETFATLTKNSCITHNTSRLSFTEHEPCFYKFSLEKKETNKTYEFICIP